MKTKLSNVNEVFSPNDAQIDAALHAYGRSLPRPGLESRVAARLAAAPRLSRFQALRSFGSDHALVWQRLSAGALGVAAACAIVLGTLQHSRHAPLPQAARSTHAGGASAAGLVHVPTRAMPAAAKIDPEAPRSPAHGRASISPNHGRRGGGTAHPRSPYPPDAQPQSAASPQQ